VKLIVEEIEKVDCILEDYKGNKSYFLKGVYMQCEQKNKNGRVYPKPILEREVARYTKEYINENKAWGELTHPDTPNVDLKNACIRITELNQNGNDFLGKALVLNTPNGNIVKALLEGGGTLGVSSRGMGTLTQKQGYHVVNEDFRLCSAADVVADPSCTSAFVNGIMENKEWLFENGQWFEQDFDKAKKIIKETSKAELEAKTLRLFEEYLKKI
jgi:hypothetical protein